MKKQPWLKLRKKTQFELPLEPPILLGSFSNGEFFHEESPRERKIRRLILETADRNARRTGMDRREFLASSAGMATSLAVLNLIEGCGDREHGTANPGAGGQSSDGGFQIPRDATMDSCAADQVLGTKDF